MNAMDQLNAYLRDLERRLRLFKFSRGAAVATLSALGITVLLVLIVNRFAFSSASLLWARILLFLSVAAALCFGLVVPLLRITRKNTARTAERRFPEFEERLLTLADRADSGDPFLQLLANDAMKLARGAEPERLAPRARIAGFLTSAGLAVAVLLWLILAGPGYLGYGTSLLWAGAPKAGIQPFYDILVTPGDKTVRRRADQLVTAQLIGFDSPKVRLFAQYKGTSKWEPVAMRSSPHGSTYEFLFGGLAETVEYFVEAGAMHSKHYTLRVADLPNIKKVKVTYHFPAWTGMADAVEDPGGDLRAVEGTEAEVAIETDRPLSDGLLMLDDGKQLKLGAGAGNWTSARVPIAKDGMYHVAALDQSENVRLSDDYFIEAKKDQPPSVKIIRPGRDMKASPIEEVVVSATAEDDFGLTELNLHYSVNGAPEKVAPLLGRKGVKSAEGKYTIALEDFRLSPGDVVSFYATAKDARTPSKTDMYFIEAQPFERNYSQAQASGGSGGEDQQQGELSQRQKEIIAATWNELKDGSKDPATAAGDAKFLSELQGKLGEQAKSLADRMRKRQLAEANPQFQNFAKDMEEAAGAMGAAVEKLKTRKWNDAIPNEQKALQHVLRAEATFRDIQVAFGSQKGGQGQGGNGRDLENLADLELDREKNQYETGQQSAADRKQKELDDAMQKLKDLARRQQELAQRKQQQDSFRQRWEQEMLRREAEELKRQMEQLSRGDSQQQQQVQQPGQEGQQGQPGQQGQQGQQSQSSGMPRRGEMPPRSQAATDPRMRQALDRLAQAADDMRRAASSQNGAEQSGAGQRRAAERLNEARDLLNGMRQQQSSQKLDEMARQAEQLAAHQQDFQNRLRQSYGNAGQNLGQPGQTSQQNERLASEKEQMAKDLDRLQKDMSDTARGLSESQTGVSAKLREALGEVEQNEIQTRMKKGAEWIRQGQGVITWVREATVTNGLNRLRDQLRQAESAMKDQSPGKNGPGKGDLERALTQVEGMRSRMEQLTGSGSKPGRQPGQQAGQQPGQQAGQQPGQQSGQQPGQQPGPGGRAIQPGTGESGGQFGQRPLGEGGSVGQHNGDLGVSARQAEEAYREAMAGLGQLRQLTQKESDLTGDVQQLLRDLQKNNPAYMNDGELADRLRRQVLPGIERLELEIRRKLDDKGDQVRSAGSESVPAGYADAVAEYFRRLSKGK